MTTIRDRSQGGIIRNTPKRFPVDSGSLFNPTAGGTALTGPLAATTAPGPAGYVSVTPGVQPDVARGLQINFAPGWDGGDVTIIGTDINGTSMEVVAPGVPGSSFVVRRAFENISEIRYPGGGTTGSVVVVTNERFGFGGGSDVSVVVVGQAQFLSGGGIGVDFTLGGGGEYCVFNDGAGNSQLLTPGGVNYVLTYF